VIDLLRLGKPIAEISSSGVLGDATGASAELGRELNELVVKLYADALQAALRPDSGRETDEA
jgi:creatinine amidohydrolase/Fe(II)-dependent formamide hydrolase-like protein